MMNELRGWHSYMHAMSMNHGSSSFEDHGVYYSKSAIQSGILINCRIVKSKVLWSLCVQ